MDFKVKTKIDGKYFTVGNVKDGRCGPRAGACAMSPELRGTGGCGRRAVGEPEPVSWPGTAPNRSPRPRRRMTRRSRQRRVMAGKGEALVPYRMPREQALILRRKGDTPAANEVTSTN